MRCTRYIFATAFVITFARWGFADTSPSRSAIETPPPASAESAAAGKEIFGLWCAQCHGLRGDGKDAQMDASVLSKKPADLTRSRYTYSTNDQGIFSTVKRGVPPDFVMPTWEAILTDEEIWNVVSYLKTLRKKDPP